MNNSGMTVTVERSSYGTFNSYDTWGSVSFVDCISGDPQFIGAGNFGLQACSQCIDHGTNAFNSTLTDLAGKNRKSNIIDLGAYEFQHEENLIANIQTIGSSSASFQMISPVCGSITEKGVLVYTSNDFNIETVGVIKVLEGLNEGNSTLQASGLSMNTTYYYRTYYTCGSGTTYYSEIKSFTTVPTLGEWGLIVFGSLIALVGGAVVWRRVV
jgi:hypothetical protein